MSNSTLAASSSRCLLHACTGFRPREALAGLAYSTCGVTQVALVSVQPSLNTYLHKNLVVWPSRYHREVRHIQAG